MHVRVFYFLFSVCSTQREPRTRQSVSECSVTVVILVERKHNEKLYYIGLRQTENTVKENGVKILY